MCALDVHHQLVCLLEDNPNMASEKVIENGSTCAIQNSPLPKCKRYSFNQNSVMSIIAPPGFS